MSKIKVSEIDINIIKHSDNDYISLTDMVSKHEEGSKLIEKWLISKNTIEFLGAWEQLNNEHFKTPEFGGIRNEAGSNKFFISVKGWVSMTNAIGIIAKSGKYGGTYAHKDIAFEFGTWISPMFKLLLIKEFQRLKEEEAKSKNIEWDYRRFLSKANYRLHTDAIKENIIPQYASISKDQESYIYANEAEILNVAVFGITSKQWKENNQSIALQGLNIRDMANIPQLTVLSNLENYNSIMIKEGLSSKDRLEKLKQTAIEQLTILSKQSYSYSIESPYSARYEQSSTFDKLLGSVMTVPKPE